MAKQILIKPIISEKSDSLSEAHGKYTFMVNKKANKIEIGKAVADMYSVDVKEVNTMTMPAKAKNRNTKRGMVRGRVSSYKKAVITLADGETINFFGDI